MTLFCSYNFAWFFCKSVKLGLLYKDNEVSKMETLQLNFYEMKKNYKMTFGLWKYTSFVFQTKAKWI